MAAWKFTTKLVGAEGMVSAAVRVPSTEIERRFGTRARVPVRGTINGVPYRSSMFPMGKGHHFMVVNRALRDAIGVKAGDRARLVMQRDDAKRTVTVPADLRRALAARPTAKKAWQAMSFTHQREYVEAIVEAKKPETRKRRVAGAVAMMLERARTRKGKP